MRFPGLVLFQGGFFVKSGASFNLFRPPHHPSQEHLRAMWTSHKGGHGRPQLKGHRAGYTRVQLLSQGQSDQWVSISPPQSILKLGNLLDKNISRSERFQETDIFQRGKKKS